MTGKPRTFTDKQVKELLEDIKTTSIGQLAARYNVSRQTILNYLHEEFIRVRDELREQGLDENEATIKAYTEVYKCQQETRTIEV